MHAGRSRGGLTSVAARDKVPQARALTLVVGGPGSERTLQHALHLKEQQQRHMETELKQMTSRQVDGQSLTVPSGQEVAGSPFQR